MQRWEKENEQKPTFYLTISVRKMWQEENGHILKCHIIFNIYTYFSVSNTFIYWFGERGAEELIKAEFKHFKLLIQKNPLQS